MAQTTIVPFTTLPACAADCGPLYDVNGACVPPNVAAAAVSVYDACFCADSRLAPFSTTTGGVCDSACTADTAGFASITAWYNSLCSTAGAAVATTTNADGSTTTVASSSSNSSSGGGGGGWLSSHWRWVIFIVVMVVGIAGIWIGAAIWRRRYLRKRDQQYALGKTLAQRTNSGQNPYGGNGSTNNSQSQRSIHPPQPGMFMPATISSANVYNEKPPKQKKKWIVRERT